MDAAAKELQFANILTLMHSPKWQQMSTEYQAAVLATYHEYMNALVEQTTSVDSVK
jgi:hypothetical protein